jgi:hypothetical protein
MAQDLDTNSIQAQDFNNEDLLEIQIILYNKKITIILQITHNHFNFVFFIINIFRIFKSHLSYMLSKLHSSITPYNENS